MYYFNRRRSLDFLILQGDELVIADSPKYQLFYLKIFAGIPPDLKVCVGKGFGHRPVQPHAVGSRDDVLGGHQGPSTEVLVIRSVNQSHNPGIFVFLQETISVL